jgi:hypothetical protein
MSVLVYTGQEVRLVGRFALHKLEDTLWIISRMSLGKSPQHTIVVRCFKMTHKNEREHVPEIAVKHFDVVPDNALKRNVS